MTRHAFIGRSAAALVALVGGIASYRHIASVALDAGEMPLVAYTLPLAIDGLIVVGVTAALEDRAAGRRPHRIAWLAVVAGVIATLAANVASAQPTWTARLVAVAAPGAFLLSVEVLVRSGRPVPPVADQTPDTSQTSRTVQRTPAKRTSAKRTSGKRTSRPPAARILAERPDISAAELARLAGVTDRHARRLIAAANGRQTSRTARTPETSDAETREPVPVA